MQCPYCNSANGTSYQAREMGFGMRHQFSYWQCSSCEAIELETVLPDLSPYYPDQYYSFHLGTPHWSRIAFFKMHFLFPKLMARVRPCREELSAIANLSPKRNARILDVGCGSGYLVKVLRLLGFNALGIDAFLLNEAPYVHRKTLDQTEGKWDIIMFNHSMEHMPNQVEVLKTVADRLAPGGVCITHIPVVGWAWKNYGVNWVHLDPPRHLTVHSLKSFNLATTMAKLKIVKTVHESKATTMWISELYMKDISPNEGKPFSFTESEIKNFARMADRHNAEGQGDVVRFYLKAA